MADLGHPYRQQQMYSRREMPAMATANGRPYTANSNVYKKSEQDNRFEGRAASQDGMKRQESNASCRARRPQVEADGICYAGYTGAEQSYTGTSHMKASHMGQTQTNGSARTQRPRANRTPDMSVRTGRREDASVSLGDLSRETGRIKKKSSTRKKKAAQQKKLRIVTTASAHSIPLLSLVVACIATAMLFFIVYNVVTLNEMTLRVSASQSQLTELIKTEKELSLKLEMKNDLLDIERIATEEYGMVKNDKVVKQYINIEGEDKIEITPADDTAEETAPRDGDPTKPATDGPLSTIMSAFAYQFESFMEAIH